MIQRIFLILVILLISSCSSTIADFAEYQQSILPKASFMPTEQMLEGKPPKVVVLELDNSEDAIVAKQADLGESMAVNIENILTAKRLAELVDRKAAKKLEKEIALAELNNQAGSYEGPKVADYAISGIISDAGFTKKYKSAGIAVDLQGRITRTPAKFIYSSEVSGNVKIYDLPSMAVAQTFEIKGRKIKTENVQADNNVSVLGVVEFGGQQVKGRDRDDNLVRLAGFEAIDSISYNLQNYFAKKGYILEKRVNNKKAIFKINLGSEDGIKTGDEFEIIGKFEITNQITEKTQIENRVIASGKVSDRINPESSWVIIKDKKSVDNIRLGDMVKFKYSRSFLNKAAKFAENLALN